MNLNAAYIFKLPTSDAVITTVVKSDPVYLEITTAVPTALIIHELLTNTYKHAFNGRKSGHITITLKQLGNTVTLVISDDA
ncbi:MAG: hypothetical protein WD267_03865 [Balneolales bacterium]